MNSLGSSGDRARDSLEVWLFKVPDRKAVEIGNAIWPQWKARAAGHQGLAGSRSHRRHFRGHGPGAA